MNQPSKRFTPSTPARILVPVVLGLLALGLLAVLVVVILSLFGLVPAG